VEEVGDQLDCRKAGLTGLMMKRSISKLLFVLVLFTNAALATDPLPSWNDTAAKKAIVTFVA
jgi:hypothetical protein